MLINLLNNEPDILRQQQFLRSSKLKASAFMLFSLAAIIANPVMAENPNSDYVFFMTEDWHSCQQIGRKYKEVYAFETSSFYVNICQKNQNYFYLGESKQENIASIFLPAYPIDNGKGYRADNGNESYHVTSKETAETLTVTRNGNQILTETSILQNCRLVNEPTGLNIRTQPDENSQKIGTLSYQSQVEIAYLNRDGNPDVEQDIDGDLWVKISHPRTGFVYYGTKPEKPTLMSCN